MNVSGLNIGVEEVVNKKIRDEFPRILTMEQVEASKRSAKEYREAINQYSKKDYNINIDDLPPLEKF